MVITVDRIAAGGDGVGRLPDGRVVFVPRTAPRDVVRITPVREARRFVRGRIEAIMKPGDGRAEPRCQHYVRDACGGCQLQHLGEEAQQEARRGIVVDALQRIGRLTWPDLELECGGPTWGYRRSITLHRAKGSLQGFGFHRFDNPGSIFLMERCEIADEALSEAWSAIRTPAANLPDTVDRLTLRVGEGARVHILIHASGPPVREANKVIGAFAQAAEATIWWSQGKGAPKLIGPGEETEPIEVFRQANAVSASSVRRWMLGALNPESGEHWWDLYAGVGETTAELIEAGATVESVEIDPRAVDVAERASLVGVGRMTGPVERWIRKLRPAEGAVLNPPRVGLSEDAVKALLDRHRGRIGYISCDPATLARDLARLGEGFGLREVRAFDQFPQTAHVEVAVVLEPR